jgi:outer membrane protein TolC
LVGIRGRRLTAAVTLVKALGGGWKATLPVPGELSGAGNKSQR